ncbi:MAG: 1-(5-phosphoribosyl)-5-[(5-phosphoribosylamino)methylideneamino]imidazole-4-carboxamide isomerase [Clostridiales bacterium]|nr:1-(5-phosphoribosyl)-5-[(5-phosphoribosylamino)methylideneamino]imidazole-4-carboxamide isomerase [Clostridiales bacterium]
MIIFPAIDIKGGTCVRLYKGEMNTAEKVADSPLETAISFKNAGSEWIHMVDLDGAVDGKRINTPIYLEVAQKSGLKVEVGGGIRKIEDIDFYIENGISRVILGSVALSNADIVKQAVKKYNDKIVVGIDARDGMVAAEGWVKTSNIDYIELAKRMEDIGVKYIIYTDIHRDGMLSGPNTQQLVKLNEAVSCNIVASGGIKDINDIIELRDNGLYGAICGRSIYKGTLNLEEAIRECK